MIASILKAIIAIKDIAVLLMDAIKVWRQHQRERAREKLKNSVDNAIDKKDQREVEKEIGASNAGKPTKWRDGVTTHEAKDRDVGTVYFGSDEHRLQRSEKED